MTTRNRLTACLTLATTMLLARGSPAAEPPEADPPPKSASSRVTAVTVYQGNALVTREVDVPEGKGLVELVVTTLPPETIDSSLYTEGGDGLRVLSTRYPAIPGESA
jgi:hypothetical protein